MTTYPWLETTAVVLPDPKTCDRCDEPTDEEHDCEECCESVCSRCMFSETLCKGCEASLEERATFPEEFEP